MSKKLDNFIRKELEDSLVKYPLVFKDFLEMGDKTYDTLISRNIISFIIGAILAGMGYAFLVYFGAGNFTMILIALGLASPISIPVLITVILGGGAIGILIKKISDEQKKKFFKILPKYINSSLDLLAGLIAEFIYAKCNDRDKVIKILVEKMGYNEKVLNSYDFKKINDINKYQDKLIKLFNENNLDFDVFLHKINTLCGESI